MWIRIALGVCGWLAFCSSVQAHDYWLQPKFFRLQQGQSSPVRLLVGDHFQPSAERPFQTKMTDSFRLVSANGTIDLSRSAVEGRTPVATIQPTTAGGHLIAMERDWAKIELQATKFNSYLEHEGLQDILEERRRSGEADQVGRERYRRYLKALIHVAGESDDVFKKRLGHRLEIIPQANPASPKPGVPVLFQVTFDGKPLASAQVAAYSRVGEETKTQESRTDSRGHVPFMLHEPGLYLVRLVHMQRCVDNQMKGWESFWAAYSFEVGQKNDG